MGQVGNVITNRNANRLEFERLLDGAKTYMRHHKVSFLLSLALALALALLSYSHSDFIV